MTKSEQAVSMLQRMIEEGRLEPGTMVSERSLMDLTNLGRTPVREAIQRLALNRMVRIHPNKGIEVPGVSVEDQLSGLEVRRAIEVLAVTLACERATTSQITQIEKLAVDLKKEFDLERYTETVRQTHDLIIEAAHNPYLEALMTPLQALSRRFWIMHIRDETDIHVGQRLHRELLIAISKRNIEAASAASMALNDYLVQFSLSVLTVRAAKLVR